MVNHFHAQMPRPLMGVGHSMGGFHLTNLALFHPRLFSTLILIDPVIQRVPNPEGNYVPAKASARRRDLWPSREVAKTSFLKSKFYQAWDPRVLNLWIEHGLRDLPTKLHPTSDGKEVTLKTTKHQEVLTFMRGNIQSASNPDPATRPNPLTHPDVDLAIEGITPFYRPEALVVFQRLPFLRPSVLYIFGSKSNLSESELRADKMAMTGVGPSGSGGAKAGRVKEVLLDAGHLIPMEKVAETADETSAWMLSELQRWRDDEKAFEGMRRAIPREKRALMTDEFVKCATGDFMNKSGKSKL